VQTITECIEVSFTPEIQGNTISMDLNFAYQSEFLETNEKGDEPIANPCPIIQRHSLGTDVKVESGRTLIIGTSIQRKKFSEVNRIDFLADLPLIGSLFQAHEMKEQELDVVIVMSPRLLSETNSEDINRE
jgi:type II secretory pathway component GspD/PulD (secretin)